ncbi:hypothetical protein ACVWU4_000869 [Campylobacter coli]
MASIVVLRTESLTLEDQKHHIATDWQVSDKQDFTNIILESIEDRYSLTIKVFIDNDDLVKLDPNKKYYGRSRALLSTGYTKWSNHHVLKIIDTVDLADSNEMPTRVAIPDITTAQDGTICDPNDHDSTMFDIILTGFEVIGTASHLATSCFIEDIFGNVVWYNLNNMLNKDRFTINNIILKSGHAYRIYAMFHTTTNDSSQLACKTIKINNGEGLEVLTELDRIYPDQDLTIEMLKISKVKKYTWEILDMFTGDALSVFTKDTTEPTVTVPKFTLRPTSNFLLRVKTDVNPSFKYIPFITQDYKDNLPPVDKPIQ